MGRFSPLAGAIALAFVALACAAVAMHSAHRQTELLAAMPPYMSSLEQKAPSQSALLRQQQLMDGLVVDPNSENPSADFYADNDDGAYDNEDDVEDAGEGNILPGWTHPELLDKPRPEDVQSFATGESGAVLKPQDYERTPGAAKTATATRQAIEKLTRQMTKTHAEAADAKAVYDAEEEKSKGLKKEYVEYQQQWQQGSQQARAHGMWDPARTPELPADTTAKEGDQEESFVVDTANSEDPAADFRKYFYNKAEAAQLQAMMARRASFKAVMAPQLNQGRLAQEENAMREDRSRVMLNRDEARLALRNRQAMQAEEARQRKPVFRGEGLGVQEGCPYGTPGCGPAAYNRPVEQPRSAGLRWGRNVDQAMARAGDSMVPANVARRQGTNFAARGVQMLYDVDGPQASDGSRARWAANGQAELTDFGRGFATDGEKMESSKAALIHNYLPRQKGRVMSLYDVDGPQASDGPRARWAAHGMSDRAFASDGEKVESSKAELIHDYLPRQ